ncbi:HTH-type transcriptional regulator CdhR [mine drainage metagenome]|uniref:HTH-type transcriptional regulator CdhR n=1 Tax=mine drainage metagenome TaxID=410659 RepID=A0A1J5PNA2_9ZZZZ
MSTDPIDVLFVVLPDTLLLDLAGPAEAFRLANQHLRRRGQPEVFRLRYVGPQAEVRTSVGAHLTGIEPLPPVIPAHVWVVLLGRLGTMSDVAWRLPVWLETRNWLAANLGPALQGQGGATRLLTICVGALLAADAGLIGRHRVTTHHELLNDLARMAPAAQVLGQRAFVDDGTLLSSAGITAGIDLALYAIAGHCGAAVAAAVAQTMVVFARRGPQADQISPLLAWRDHMHPALHRVQDAVCEHPEHLWNAAALARVALVTPRHLNRLFREQAGISPRDYVERVRLALAEQALAQGAPVTRSAELAGFSSPRQLRRARSRA